MSNSKKGPLYELADGIFGFKYGVADRANPLVRTGHPEEATEAAMGMLPGFMGKRFEDICREYMMRSTEYRFAGKWRGNDPEGQGMPR